MKHIASIHPYSFIPGVFGNYEGIQVLNGVPLVVSDNAINPETQFLFATPDDLVNNTVVLTFYWTYSSIQSLIFLVRPGITTQQVSPLSSILVPWEIQKATITIHAPTILPNMEIRVKVDTNQALGFILGVLVEGLDDN